MAAIAETLALALHNHQAGHLEQAEQGYRQVLRVVPRHAEALHLLGIVSCQQDRYPLGIDCLRQAIAADPSNGDYHCDLAVAYQNLGRLDEALACFEQALRLKPNCALAWYNLGNLRQGQGQLDQAVASYRQALLFLPDHVAALFNLGNTLIAQGKLVEAVDCYSHAVRLRPDYTEAYFNLGVALHRQGRLDEALASYRQALRLQPGSAEVHNNLGNVLKELGRPDEARAAYQQARRFRPDDAEALNNLGNLCQDQGQPDEAAVCYQQALRLRPDYAVAHYNLGTLYQNQARTDEAEACYQRALHFKPDYAAVYDHLGTVYQHQGRTDEARDCFARAQALGPRDGCKVKSALLLPVIPESAADIRERRRLLQENLTRLQGENLSLEAPHLQVGSTVFHLAYHGLNDRDLQAQIASLFARACPALLYVAPHCCPPAPPGPPSRPLRVGFISKYFHNHPVSLHYGGILRNLAREQVRVVLFRFVGPEDAASRSLQESADEVVTLAPQHDLDVLRRQIAGQRLDVLCYTDLGIEPWTYFLAFARLAPVQCVLGGHPVTTGIPTIDYFLSGQDLEPAGAEGHYTERLVRLENLPNFFYRTPLAGAPPSRNDFGIPANAHWYLCPQSLFKIHPDFDDLMGAILRADSNGRLLLFHGQDPHWTRLLTARLRRHLAGEVDRVHVLPHQPFDRYLHLLRLADAVLDTPHFSGGTTSYQALGLGAPIITLPGEFYRGRQTYAYYRRLGVLDCVAADAADYVRLAVRLATDPAWRGQVRARILAANHVLFTNTAVVRELERFFLEAVDRARAPSDPAH